MDPVSAAVSVDVVMPFSDYKAMLFRIGESLNVPKCSAEAHLAVAKEVMTRAKAALSANIVDQAFILFCRVVQIVEKSKVKEICTPSQRKEFKELERGALDVMEKLVHSSLPQLHNQIIRNIEADLGERQRILALQMSSDAVDNDDEMTASKRKEEVLEKQEKLAAHLLGKPIEAQHVSTDVSVDTLDEHYHRIRQQRAQENEESLARKVKDSFGSQKLRSDEVGHTGKTYFPLPVQSPAERSTHSTSGTRPWPFPKKAASQSRRGMVNLGNTCYLNSVTQCVAQSLLGQYFLGDEYISSVMDPTSGGGRIVNTFSFIERELFANSQYPVSPSRFKVEIGRVNSNFSGREQQDANEFLRTLIDSLHEDLNQNKHVKTGFKEIDNTHGTDQEIAEQYWRLYEGKNKSVICDLFAFQEKSTVQCPACGRVSRTFGVGMGIDLAIPSLGRPVTIEECLSAYCAPSALDDQSLFRCQGCNNMVPAVTKQEFFTCPMVLVVTLKRFRSFGEFSNKIDTPVIFGAVLDMKPFVEKAGPFEYELIGVVNHKGNIHGGHYTCDCRGAIDHAWFFYSDERFTESEHPDFCLAYMLFYQRCSI
jgi:ubiquitin carboxyl-terminal hydrolase 2/21